MKDLNWRIKLDAFDLFLLDYLNQLDENVWTSPYKVSSRIKLKDENNKTVSIQFIINRFKKLRRYGLLKTKVVDGVTYYKLSKNVKFKGDDIIYLRINGMIIKLIEEKPLRPKISDIPLKILKDEGVDIFEGVEL